MNTDNNKKKGRLEKIILGLVIGGAVGSVVGATVKNKSVRKKIQKKINNTTKAVDNILQKQKKKTIWHTLNTLLIKKKDKNL